MTIRCGMSGDAVRRIEELLSALKLYSGRIDSSFGGGLESAVKNFQSQHGLAPTGLVDFETWGVMFPGEPSPPSPLANAPLAERCLALVGSFETGKYHPDCFCGITGDFDGMGISFGVLQWNVGQGSLQPIMKQMFEQHPDLLRAIFNEHFEDVKALGDDNLEQQLAFTRSIQRRGQIREPWFGMLETLGRAPECQSIQTAHSSDLFDRALQLCGEYGLFSERGAALMFDVVTQNGSIGTSVRARIRADYQKLPHNDPGNEVARMCIIGARVTEASRASYADDVRARKSAIANGGGKVHGIAYDLADMFNLTLNPFGTGASAASGGR